VLKLPFVPRLRVKSGKAAEIGVREPDPPRADTTLDDRAIFEHVAQLWCETYEVVFGVSDHQLRHLATPRKRKCSKCPKVKHLRKERDKKALCAKCKKLKPDEEVCELCKLCETCKRRAKKKRMVLDWWKACEVREVRPANWIYWGLTSWREIHGSKKASPGSILSAARVNDGRKRRGFRISSLELGGVVRHDDVGRSLMRRIYLLQRKIEQLVMRDEGVVEDDRVRDLVMEVFPRGPENAAKILEEVHQRCLTETMDLRRRAKQGSFVWRIEQ
jgi:hypothetical protein